MALAACSAVSCRHGAPPARASLALALVAQSVEHVLGKDGVTGSNPVEGSNDTPQRLPAKRRNGGRPGGGTDSLGTACLTLERQNV